MLSSQVGNPWKELPPPCLNNCLLVSQGRIWIQPHATVGSVDQRDDLQAKSRENCTSDCFTVIHSKTFKAHTK